MRQFDRSISTTSARVDDHLSLSECPDSISDSWIPIKVRDISIHQCCNLASGFFDEPVPCCLHRFGVRARMANRHCDDLGKRYQVKVWWPVVRMLWRRQIGKFGYPIAHTLLDSSAA